MSVETVNPTISEGNKAERPLAHSPMVSVIVTTYNQEDTLSEAIESILAQKINFKIEIEISDDSSTDNTPEICEHYAKKYPEIIRYHRNEVNIGARANYFNTLLRCRGKYIADLAGDDRWVQPDKLSEQIAALEKDNAIVLSHTDWQYLHTDSGTHSPSGNRADSPELAPLQSGKKLLVPILNAGDHMVIHSCTSVYRADVAQRAVSDNPEWFNNPTYPCEDLQLMCFLADAGKVHFLNKITLDYRVSPDQITSDKNPAKAFDFNFGTLQLRYDLADHFQIPYQKIPRLIDHARYVIGMARRANDRTRYNSILAFCRERNIPIPLRSRLRNLIFSLIKI